MGKKHTEKTRRKISESWTPERRKKYSEMYKGKRMTWGDNTFYKSEEYRKKQRLKKVGDKAPSWKGGISRNHRIYIPIMKSLEQTCSICDSKTKLVTHHIDWNFRNNDISNICIVCRSCHNKIHKTKHAHSPGRQAKGRMREMSR